MAILNYDPCKKSFSSQRHAKSSLKIMHQITIFEHDLFEKINNAPRIFITISFSEIEEFGKILFGKVNPYCQILENISKNRVVTQRVSWKIFPDFFQNF